MRDVLTKSTVVDVSPDITGLNYRLSPTRRVFPGALLGSQEKEEDANESQKVNENVNPGR